MYGASKVSNIRMVVHGDDMSSPMAYSVACDFKSRVIVPSDGTVVNFAFVVLRIARKCGIKGRCRGEGNGFQLSISECTTCRYR